MDKIMEPKKGANLENIASRIYHYLSREGGGRGGGGGFGWMLPILGRGGGIIWFSGGMEGEQVSPTDYKREHRKLTAD